MSATRRELLPGMYFDTGIGGAGRPQPPGLSTQFLRDLARDLPLERDPWRLAETARVLARAADEIDRLREGQGKDGRP